MKKMRWISWALSVAMLATPCASFAQEVSADGNARNNSTAAEAQQSATEGTANENNKENAGHSEGTESDQATSGSSDEKASSDQKGENAKSTGEGTTVGQGASSENAASTQSADANASSKVSTQAEYTGEWTTADFTYGDYSKLMYGCDYKRQFYVKGKVITGFSAQGEEKLKENKDLVIPAKDPDGNKIVGIGESAFREKGLESVQFPTGMLAAYDDNVTTDPEEKVSRRGNFVIGESSFYKNNLKEVILPNGVISVLSKAFECN